jgi:uncharacterized membrane protein (DUF4010 family)
MDLPDALRDIGISLGLGLLIGLQRERAEKSAGIRTFPLITLAGTLCALLAQTFGGWIVGLGLLSLAMIIVLSSRASAPGHPQEAHIGLTTAMAMLVMFGVGAFLVAGPPMAAVVTAGVVAVLLHLKPQMHRFVGRIGDRDFKAIMQFVVISLVILPVLPNETFGPLDVLNPFRIWLMVVLIVGISLGGYVTYKLFGPKVGILAAGALGGLISSTATTVTFARRSHEGAGIHFPALIILLASAVAFVRLLLIIAATAPGFLAHASPPLGILFAVLIALSFRTWQLSRRETAKMPGHANPSELRTALLFAALYAAVLLAVAAAKQFLGTGGLYAVAAISGLPDTDAITLSVIQMLRSGQVDAHTGWRLILVATMANLVFKAGIVLSLGDRRLRTRITSLFGITLGAGLLLLCFWPDLAEAPVADPTTEQNDTAEHQETPPQSP